MKRACVWRALIPPHRTGAAPAMALRISPTWEALLLIDSGAGRIGPQSIFVASPFYVLDR